MTAHQEDGAGDHQRALAQVRTDTAPRYAKQLASHFGRKATVEELPEGHRLHLRAGRVDILPYPGHLLLEAAASDAGSLAVVQDVIGRHLERFGQRDGLVVSWSPQAD